jgi:protein TonB
MTTAAYSVLRPRPSGLLPYLVGSLGAHVLVVAAWLILAWAFGRPSMDLEQTPIKASLVRLGKPRDEKLLPRKEEEPPPPVKAPEPVKVPTPVAVAPDTAVKIPSKDAKPDKDKPSAEKKDPKRSLFDAMNKAARPGKVEEAEGAADGDPNGDSAKQEGERYFGLLKSVVQRNYDVSDTIPEAERRTLKAEVALWLGRDGEVLNVKLTKPSGNELFDAAVLGAVKKASPFSPPPDHLRDSLKKQGVAFVFRAVN